MPCARKEFVLVAIRYSPGTRPVIDITDARRQPMPTRKARSSLTRMLRRTSGTRRRVLTTGAINRKAPRV